jgi:hypothetical protein
MATPTSIFNKPLFGGAGGAGAWQPKGNTYNPRYRTLPVTQIMSQREGKTGGYNTETGQALAPGTRFFSPGWNSSGVGPGTRGYTGSWRPGGYNFGEGTRRPSAKTADEFYAQRDETSGNPLDNLEMGNSNLMGSFLKNAIAEARGQQSGVEQPGVTQDAWAGRTTFGSNPTGVQQQTVTTALGEIPIGPGSQNLSQEPDAAQIQQMIADARRQEAIDAEDQMMLELQARDPQALKTQSNRTTPGATIEGMPSDLYFQYKANESGESNDFSNPMSPTDSTNAWQYSHRLAPFLKRLGIGQPFPSRRPF